MQKIDKSATKVLSTKYMDWLGSRDIPHGGNNRNFYDDVVMNLFCCQDGVCAYTEMRLCPEALYAQENWINGRYKAPDEYERTDHFGELEHFDPKDKLINYWRWENLFMIHAKINDLKKAKPVPAYLKPDITDYEPENYFEYDAETNRFVPNPKINEPNTIAEIDNAIRNVLYLNHQMVRKNREDYINEISDKLQRGAPIKIDRFFTAVNWVFGIEQ